MNHATPVLLCFKDMEEDKFTKSALEEEKSVAENIEKKTGKNGNLGKEVQVKNDEKSTSPLVSHETTTKQKMK